MQPSLVLLLAVFEIAQASTAPILTKGAIIFTDKNGDRKEIRIGKRCADLWVSPDDSVIAFISVEKETPATAGEVEPFIEQSSLFVASRADNFNPVRLALNSLIVSGRSWKVVEGPSVSPDLRRVYFLIPYTMTSRKLASIPLAGGTPHLITDVTTYCVIWGGEHSGDLLMQVREDASPNDPDPEVSYQCYARNAAGHQTRIANEKECSLFDSFAAQWSGAHSGACRTNLGFGGK